MAPAPQFYIEIHEILPSGAMINHGLAELGYAAAISLARGIAWNTETVPASIEACRAIPAKARPAAWQEKLVSPGLPAAFSEFAGRVEKWGGAGPLAVHFSVLESAERIADHANWLKLIVSEARVVEWPTGGFVSLPLTGEIVHECEALSMSHEPFAFTTLRARFEGLDARELADFAKDGGSDDGRSLASEFLSFCLRSPELWFRDVEVLDEAVSSWMESGDFPTLQSAIVDWNAIQHVSPLVADMTAVALVPGTAHRDVALAWCDDHLQKARALVAAVRRKDRAC